MIGNLRWYRTVFSVLTLDIFSRDDDLSLYFAVLLELGVEPGETVASLMLKIRQKEVPTFDYVTRARRKLQESNAHLRGSTWNNRQLHAQKIKEALAEALVGALEIRGDLELPLEGRPG